MEDILHHFPQVQPSQTYFAKTTEKLPNNNHKHFYDNYNNHQIKLYASPIYGKTITSTYRVITHKDTFLNPVSLFRWWVLLPQSHTTLQKQPFRDVLKARIHCEICLSDYSMKHSLIRISSHLVWFHEIHIKYLKRICQNCLIE